MLDHSVPVSLVLDYFEIRARIPLMGGSQLVVPNHLFVGYLLPFRGADVMLSMYQWIADKADVRHDADEVGSWHRVPSEPVHFRVVHLLKHTVGMWKRSAVRLQKGSEYPEHTVNVGARIACRRIQSLSS